MEKHIVYDNGLTKADRLVLKALAVDVEARSQGSQERTDRQSTQDAKQDGEDHVQSCKFGLPSALRNDELPGKDQD